MRHHTPKPASTPDPKREALIALLDLSPDMVKAIDSSCRGGDFASNLRDIVSSWAFPDPDFS